MFSDQRLKSESHLLTNDASKGWTNSTTWEGSNGKSQFGIPNVANVGPAEPAGSALVCVLTRDREPSMVQEYLPFSSSLLCAKAKVTPLRGFTVPRSELSGGVLVSRLMLTATMALSKLDLKSLAHDASPLMDSDA